MTVPFLILVPGADPKTPRTQAEESPAPAPPGEKPNTAEPLPVGRPAPLPIIEETRTSLLGLVDRIAEARRFADLGKSMRLVDPERPHEAHLVGPDLADPNTWRHTLLVDDQPFTDQEFDLAEEAFLSALRAGAVPAADGPDLALADAAPSGPVESPASDRPGPA